MIPFWKLMAPPSKDIKESYIPLTWTEGIHVPVAAFKTNQHFFHLPNVATELSTPEGVP